MLPPLRQRLLITAAVIVGGVVWMRAEPGLLPSDHTGGVTLVDASVGPFLGLILAVVAGLAAIALAAVAGAVGNPLAAAFVFAGSLMFVAADGGTSLPFLWHTTPSDYLPLLFETLVWFALLAGTLWLTAAFRGPIRRRFPWLVSDQRPFRSPLRGLIEPPSLIAAAVSAGVAGVLATLMIRTWDVGQVLGALTFAFMIGSLIAQVVTPAASAGPILLSPLLLAAYGYLQTWLGYSTAEQLLAGAYRGSLHGLAWTLPIHFASAAVVGCTLGLGMAKGLVGAGKALRQDDAAAAGA